MRKLKLLLAALALTVGASSVWAQDAGTYYIQNVSNGKWLGPGNDWGTQASVLNHADYWKLAKISDGVYTLESVVSNGNANYYLSGTYCDGGATNFTFTAVDGKDNTYTIANGEGGLLTTNGTTVNVSGTDATAEASQWKFWSESDMAAGMAAATVENPFDATYLIKDHDLGRNNRDYSAWSNTGATAPKSSTDAKGATRFSIEAYHATFDVNQTLSGVPNGVYALRVNGFYRQDDSSTLPYLYANTASVTLPVRTGTENNMQDAAVSFEAGNYLSDPVYVQVTDGTLKVGVKTEGNSCWVIFKNFHLAYYGDCTVAEVVLADYVKAYNEALTEAQAFTEESMFATAWNTLQTAISDNTLNLNSVTQEQLETATANLKAANAAANAAVKAKPVYDSAVALINGGTNVDLTSIVTNASFEEGNLNGWTTVNGGATANNNNWAKVGTWYVERWTQNKNNIQAQLSDGTLTHDALVLPAGLYTVTAKAQNQEQQNGVPGTGYFLYANDEKVEITGTNTYSTSVLLTDKAELVIKFALENCTGNWISCDDIHLTYIGEDYPAYTLVTGKMNAEVAAAQTMADETFKANKTITNYNALIAAINAAQASKDAYAAAVTAIANANALKEAHNLASATAYATFAEAISALETKYEENTMTTNEGNGAGTTLGTVVTDWHAGTNGATVQYMNDGFSLNDFEAALYINTWSNEGESDGSNFKVPFYEYFAGDGSSLGAKTWTGTLTGLENGLYSVSAWVRVRTMNDATAATDATGISMNVNGGASIDVTEGTQIGESRFQLKEYTAEGLVKDGTLNFNMVIDAENNIHWLSFKNVKYTKVRDLTEEEAAVAPTAIALYNGETEVTEPIALNATNNSVTLTVAYTPNNATEGITWESSDKTVATVANGVVTGVAPGTATITATSTLDANVNATATVTVTYPESTVPVSFYANEGATRKVTTIIGENLIKNGSFEYPNAYYGWTYGTGSTTAITSEKFDIVTEGAADGNQYLKAKTNEGGAAAGSLNTSWPIEPNKTYVFGYKVKSTAASTGNQYLGASLNTTKGQENTNTKLANPAYNANEWTVVQYVFESGDNTWLVFNARWLAQNISFDNFYLAEAKYTLEGNVDYATAAIPTANIGTGAFQYSQDAIDATGANTLVQGESTVEDVQNAYDALQALELKVPAADKLYNIINISEGYNHTGKAVTFKSASDADLTGNTTTMGYTELPGSTYPQGVKFTATGEPNTYILSYTRADGNTVYVGTGSSTGLGSSNDQIRPTTDAENAVAIKVVATATEGVWNLYNTLANKNIGANGANDQGFYTTNQFNSMKIQEAVANEVALNITAANQYGTLIVPFDAAIPSGVVAYSCGNVDGTTLELSTEETSFKANTPYIVFAEAGITETLSGIGAAYTDATYTAGLLTGIYADYQVPVGSYILQNQNDVVAFYVVEENKQPMLKANHAYLTVGNSAREALYFGGDATGIMAIDALTSGNATIFNAAGAQIPALQKGMNIVRKADGKSYKVIVK